MQVIVGEYDGPVEWVELAHVGVELGQRLREIDIVINIAQTDGVVYLTGLTIVAVL